MFFCFSCPMCEALTPVPPDAVGVLVECVECGEVNLCTFLEAIHPRPLWELQSAGRAA